GSDELVKGFEYEKGAYVLVSDEDIQAAQKEAIGTIEVIRFVDGTRIDPIYYCHAHYLTPRRGKTATEAFALLRQAMVEEEKIALAKVVIRNKEHLLAIRPHDWTLVAFTLHYPEEIRSTEEMKEAATVKAAKVDKQSLMLAKSLIQNMTGSSSLKSFQAMITRKL
ncbi:MAG: Ku protein, partial [Syntrophobacteraceae bacterium]